MSPLATYLTRPVLGKLLYLFGFSFHFSLGEKQQKLKFLLAEKGRSRGPAQCALGAGECSSNGPPAPRGGSSFYLHLEAGPVIRGVLSLLKKTLKE